MPIIVRIIFGINAASDGISVPASPNDIERALIK